MPFRVRPDRLKNHKASCKHLTAGGIPAYCLGVSDTSLSDDALKAYPIRDTKVKGGKKPMLPVGLFHTAPQRQYTAKFIIGMGKRFFQGLFIGR
jgi:hypothetical protein